MAQTRPDHDSEIHAGQPLTWHATPQHKTVHGQNFLVLAQNAEMALCVRAEEWELMATVSLASTGLSVVRTEFLA